MIGKDKEWKVVNNIPIPKRLNPGGRRKVPFPFKQMKKGDSFLYCTEITEGKQRGVANAARNWKNKTGREAWHFIARQTEEGIRVWRVK